MITFNVGDVVRLKSYGPAMVVSSVFTTASGVMLGCQWFTKEGDRSEILQTATFNAETVYIVQ
jgi:uncharacterized protein YodC (DUF2158 family)